jgi:hypothetical protein
MKSLILLFLLPLTGCYSIISINLGSVNHEAATTGPPIPPEVQCAALAAENVETPELKVVAEQTCQTNVAEARKLKAKK